jgi:hypothetical protein
MPLNPQISGWDDTGAPLDRYVLFAVELIDPITRALVSRGVSVRVAGLVGKPIVSHSGRFVWLEEGTAWPEAITVDTGRLPFVPHIAAPPPRPPDLATATAEQRRVRISLRPTISYPIEDGFTTIRGALVESPAPTAPPIAGARVQLAWRDLSGNWSPLPPPPEIIGPGQPPSPKEQETTAAGEFLVFVNLRLDRSVKPDIDDKGFLAVRLQVTQGRSAPITRVTPDDFPFLPVNDDPNGIRRGRICEGRVLARNVRLAWNDLTPI